MNSFAIEKIGEVVTFKEEVIIQKTKDEIINDLKQIEREELSLIKQNERMVVEYNKLGLRKAQLQEMLKQFPNLELQPIGGE